MRRVFAILALALVCVPPALGGNAPNSRLDSIASAIANRPMTVWCETSELDWDVSYDQWGTYGFFVPRYPDAVYLSPSACKPLQIALSNGRFGYVDAGLHPLAIGLLTLVHESVHAAGVSDEALTECHAVRLLPSYAGQFVPKTYSATKLFKRGKRIVRRQIRYSNPDFSKLLSWVRWHHDRLPAEYRGATC